jgi:hypothetical protein
MPAGFSSPRPDAAAWTALKDLKNLVFYSWTYDNLRLRPINLKKPDMKPGAPQKATSMPGGGEGVGVTGNRK